MNTKNVSDAADALRLAIREPELFFLQKVCQTEDCLVLHVSTKAGLYKSSNVFLLTLALEKSGFKDRIWDVNGENYEALSVELINTGEQSLFRLEKKYLDEAEGHGRKGSFDMLACQEDDIRKLIFYETEQVLLQKFNSVEVVKTDIYKGKSIYVAWSAKVRAWVVVVKNICKVIREDHEETGRDFGEVMKALKKVNDLEKFKKDIEGCTVICKYFTEVKFIGILQNSVENNYLVPDSVLEAFARHELPCANFEKLGYFHNISEFYQNLLNEYTEEYAKPYENLQTGARLYLIEIYDRKKYDEVITI